MNLTEKIRKNKEDILQLFDDFKRVIFEIEKLTPQGSEFAGDPWSCLEHIRHEIYSGRQAKKDRVLLKREVDKYKKMCDDLVKKMNKILDKTKES